MIHVIKERLNEPVFIEQLRDDNKNKFLKFVENYEKSIAPTLRSNGYKRVNQSERTVLFTFGEITFTRSRWYKAGRCFVPTDEKLGLKKNTRYSPEFIYQIVKLATYMSYRQVVEVVELVYGISITKDTVLKAIKYAEKLLQEKEDYRFYTEEVGDKKPSPQYLYIEGDGVMVKSSDEKSNRKNIDIAHFIVHEGSQIVHKRARLIEKKEFISVSYREAKDKLIDYIYNHYDIQEDTILITNSDGGHGYTPYVFKEIAKNFKFSRHEHFWDRYHVNKLMESHLRDKPNELEDSFYKAIEHHDRNLLKTALDTLEASLEDYEIEKFDSFKKSLLNNFQYTKTAKSRGLPNSGIGIMESQHRKVTYRMKKRGMNWSIAGADRMTNVILLRNEGMLRDLFFGEWRKEYEKVNKMGMTGGEVKRGLSKGNDHRMPNGSVGGGHNTRTTGRKLLKSTCK